MRPGTERQHFYSRVSMPEGMLKNLLTWRAVGRPGVAGLGKEEPPSAEQPPPSLANIKDSKAYILVFFLGLSTSTTSISLSTEHSCGRDVECQACLSAAVGREFCSTLCGEVWQELWAGRGRRSGEFANFTSLFLQDSWTCCAWRSVTWS